MYKENENSHGICSIPEPNAVTAPLTGDYDASDKQIDVTWSLPAGEYSKFRVELLDGSSLVAFNEPSTTTAYLYSQNMKNGYPYTVTIETRSQLYQQSMYISSDLFTGTIKTKVQGID